MTDASARHTTSNMLWIDATPDALYRAFTDPGALAVWFAPGEMTGEVHHFDGRAGGGYEMSLYYPSSEHPVPGKTTDQEDRYAARFVELTPPARIVEAITFDTRDPALQGEMLMEVTFAARDGGTLVTIAFMDIPAGIRAEDNEAGTQLTLEKLARYVGRETGSE
jgi:uncharacterized protein YndB with AHSA1/START domain